MRKKQNALKYFQYIKFEEIISLASEWMML
jgi:hypothetical protein